MDKFDATLTLVGGPTTLIEIAGVRLLTDPTFVAAQPGGEVACPRKVCWIAW
jgi:L-ascorbate metabolism protein UlaG (beta-lactamase superfamily)